MIPIRIESVCIHEAANGNRGSTIAILTLYNLLFLAKFRFFKRFCDGLQAGIQSGALAIRSLTH